MSNHIDRFHAALLVVAGHGNIKQRLTVAFEEHLSLVEDEELPVAVREDFAELKSLVTGVEPLNGEGRIRATVRKMSVPEADRCAHSLVELYGRVIRLGDREDEVVPLNIGEPTGIPAFLLKSASS
jgi:hypothetical protein